MRKEAVRMGADTVLVTYQTRTGRAGEAYRCAQAEKNFRPAVTWGPNFPQAGISDSAALTPTPTARPVEGDSVRVRIVRAFGEVAGCTYLAEANPQMRCRKPYDEPAACMAWQTAEQRGDALLLDGDKGHIYRCAKP